MVNLKSPTDIRDILLNGYRGNDLGLITSMPYILTFAIRVWKNPTTVVVRSSIYIYRTQQRQILYDKDFEI